MKTRKQIAKDASDARWSQRNKILKELQGIATKTQLRYLAKAKEKTLIAMAEIIKGLARKQ